MVELPLPNYDELPLGTLQHRIRSLDRERLERLMAYEREHADRIPVLEVMRTRLDELAAGAEPSPGTQESTPEVSEEPRHSRVDEASAAEPATPMRHGVAGQTPERGRP